MRASEHRERERDPRTDEEQGSIACVLTFACCTLVLSVALLSASA